MVRNTPERRSSTRYALACPVRIRTRDGKVLAETRAQNISDGGMFVSLPADRLPECKGSVDLDVSVPRFTPNTYMLEQFSCHAQVVRHQSEGNGHVTGAGLQFEPDLNLRLEV